MPLTIQVDGLAAIQICLANGGTLAQLGYSINGVEIDEVSFTEDIHGDENGGEAGPPIDVQHHGDIARIRMTLSKWDETVANLIRANVAGGVAGVVPATGTLLFGGGHAFRVLINTPSRPRNFPLVLFSKEPKTVNKGTRHSRLILHGVAYRNGNRVLYDATTTPTYTWVAP